MKNQVKRKRPSWDEYFINFTIQTAARSSCLKRNVGAVIVKDKHILATGYNGAPRGIDSCFDKGYCIRREMDIEHGKDKNICAANHAEENAIFQAAKIGIPLEGSTIYITNYPCLGCARAIINSGIKEVHYLFSYYGQEYEIAKEFLKEAKVKTVKFKADLEKIAKENPDIILR